MRSGWILVGLACVGCAGGAVLAQEAAGPTDAGLAGDAVAPSTADAAAAPPSSDGAAPPAPLVDGGTAGVFDATGPATWTEDGGFASAGYTVVRTTGGSGAVVTLTVPCLGQDTLLLPDCHCWFEGGLSATSGAVPNPGDPDASLANAWQCVVTASSPKATVSITASAECIRAPHDAAAD